jgi:hypothetical protein
VYQIYTGTTEHHGRWVCRDPETDGDILTYNQWQYYAAVDETTTFLESQVINTINAPLVGVLHAPSSAGLGGFLSDFISNAGEDRTYTHYHGLSSLIASLLHLLYGVVMQHKHP